ncbi:MAG TPA: subclass B3 metallo-beta-lactamase [Vicinamibacterales bacterium]|jgi:metallo-beta-lactamase class B|nr:subclass B3 metallo-beta-lactamase [Vicinamibacterales bacterium]
MTTKAPGSRLQASGLVLLALFSATLVAQQQAKQRAEWNQPQKPFKVFGNTYWVGTRGLGSVLITSDRGHVLIDGALPESVPQIRDHIRELGFKLEDVRLLLNTHVHYDHAGGLGELQRLTGARAAGSADAAKVFASGESGFDDPQYGILPPIERLKNVEVVREGQLLKVGSLIVVAHLTPGHTPGGTSWSWRSCEGDRCLDVVYADSLTPVSADGFKYSSSPLAKAFERSYATLEMMRCDILLTPHPDFAKVLEKLAARNAGKADAFIDSGACKGYVATARMNLARRLETEKGK